MSFLEVERMVRYRTTSECGEESSVIANVSRSMSSNHGDKSLFSHCEIGEDLLRGGFVYATFLPLSGLPMPFP